MNYKLKPCPFCGGEAYTYTCSRGSGLLDVWLAHCKKCGINIPTHIYKVCETEQEAVDIWNERS